MSEGKRGQAPAPESVPPLTSMPPTAAESRRLRAYQVQRHQMRPGCPLTFPDGEHIVAVLSSSPVPGYERTGDVDVTVLVELP